jgi:hypothetical protein
MVGMMAVFVTALLFPTHARAKLGNQSAVEKMRRLREPLPQACIDSCPGASSFYDEIMALPEDGNLRQRANLICAHDRTVRCMSQGGAGFSACENVALNQGSPTALDEVECGCNVCTTTMDRIIESIETFDEIGDSAGARFPLLCQQVGLEKCFLHNPSSCLWAIDDLGFNELPTAEECEAEDYPTAQFSAARSARFDWPSAAQRTPLTAIRVAVVAAAFGIITLV